MRFAAALAICAALGIAGTAGAQAFPDRPIRFIVPFPPGGGTDTFARIVSAKLSETLGHLDLLEDEGRVRQDEEDGLVRYSAV